MEASKENARRAQQELTRIIGGIADKDRKKLDTSIEFLTRFLERAFAKLPREISYAKAKGRS